MKGRSFVVWLFAIAVAAPLNASGQVLAPDDQKGRVDNLVLAATKAEMLTLGSTWEVNECCGWTGTWKRRPGTNIFDGRWTGPNGMIATDTMTLVGWDKRTNRVIISRQNNNGTYWGVLNPVDGTIGSGGTSWYPAGATWSARVWAVQDDEKGPVKLPIRR